MTLQPEDLPRVRFSASRGSEGYHMGQVDQYLDLVEERLAAWTTRIDALAAHNRALRSPEGAEPFGAPEADAAAGVDPFGPDPLGADALSGASFAVVPGPHGYEKIAVDELVDEVRATALDRARRLEELRTEHRVLCRTRPCCSRSEHPAAATGPGAKPRTAQGLRPRLVGLIAPLAGTGLVIYLVERFG